ncbi:hypothetical protein [Mariprofundus ferrooxydans]|uniref:hypothetical protein n=1 Tax=Mariprofundus ferrooxydans TaxID=314344 RepID=UPI00036559C9|nr:hypothetical protein [Mariprofundus ferrooxydans]
MKIVQWFAFLWGCVAAGAMLFYFANWFMSPDSPLRNELLQGAAIWLLYGWPSWIILPVVLYLRRPFLSPVERAILLCPLAVAACASVFFTLP